MRNGKQVAGSILGTQVQRKEDPKFLTSGGVYVDDLTDELLDGAAYVAYSRSDVAHGSINSIEIDVVGPVHHTHPSCAELGEDLVVVYGLTYERHGGSWKLAVKKVPSP